MKNTNKTCPLFPVEKRLLDCFTLIMQTKLNYFDPDKFRLSLNNAIQTLRTVTFVLQKHKSELMGFDGWYRPWQDLMGKDQILKWLVVARNTIVKQGDLDTFSIARATVIESWDGSPMMEMKVKASNSTSDIAESIRGKIKNKERLVVGLLKIERRWVDSLLPGKELIESLMHVYDSLQSILIDAHSNLLSLEISKNCNFDKHFGKSSIKPPFCLIAQDWDRTMWFDLFTGDALNCETHREDKVLTVEDADRISAHYPEIAKIKREGYSVESLEKRAKFFFEHAKVILKTDGYHIPMAFLGYSNNQVRQCALILRNRADKHLAYRKLATDIEKTGAVSFVFITEVWKAPSNDAHLTKEGMESTGLKESLDVIAADKTGKIYWCSAEFEKNADGQLIIGNEVCKYTELSTFNWLIPIFKAWKIVDPHIYKEIAKRAEPSSAKLCLCGSGQTFEKCCSGKYSQGINGLEKAHEFYRLHNFSKALNICRLSITQYLIWHKQHTVPIQTYAHSAVLKIMYVDIMSMFEHIEFLMFCYEKNGIHDDFPNVLHFMADKIDDVRWKNLLVFQEACWELFPNWTPEGEEKARRILLRIKDMDAVYDPRILQLYLQLFRDLMQFPKAIALIGKIVQYSVPIEEKLQYGAMMGIEYLQILDNASAIKELKNAILGFKKAAPKELTFEQTYRIGSTIALLGKLTEDTSAIEEAIICLEKGLGLIDLNAFEKAALLCAIAEAYESQHDWTKAVEYFNKSHKEVNNDLMVVFSAKALIRMGELEKVRKLLECVNFDSLDENGRFDFGIAWSDFAIQTSEHSDIEKALALLELHKPKTPYFKKVKEDLIAELKRSKDTNI